MGDEFRGHVSDVPARPLAWTSDPPTVPGDYLYAYRFEPDSPWTYGRMVLMADELLVESDTSDTRWFGPIPPLPGPSPAPPGDETGAGPAQSG